MRGHLGKWATAALLAMSVGAVAQAGTLNGKVINRTTGQPAAGVEVTILSPMENMRELGTVKSDAQGEFTLTKDEIGMGPLLARATFEGVPFNTSLRPGQPSAEVDVFEVTKDAKALTVVSHVIILQPQGEKLIGGEEYVVSNASNPPKAFFKTEGNFEFGIPEKAELQQVSTVGTSGMSIAQAPIEKGKGLNGIAYAFRPGETSVRLSYELAYPGNAATVKLPALYPGVKLLVVAPPGVTLKADGLTAAGQEQGMQIYSHEPLAVKSALTVGVSGVGTAPAPQEEADGQAQAQEGNSRTGNQEVQAVPGRLDSLKWPLLIGFGLLFGLGAFSLTRKQVIAVPAEEDEDVVAPVKSAKSKAGAATAVAETAKRAVADAHTEVSSSLDALKDAIFRLELRKQAGTITEEDYARERAGVEQKIRDLVRG